MRWPRAGELVSRLRLVDLARVGTIGLRARRCAPRSTALGIAIGIAAMVAVVGISASSRADVLAQLDGLGTDMLRVAPGQTAFGDETTLPESARAVADRIGPVTSAAGLTGVDASVRRNDHIDESITGGIWVVAADTGVLDAISGELADRSLPRRRVEPGADRRARRRRRRTASASTPSTRRHGCGSAGSGSS